MTGNLTLLLVLVGVSVPVLLAFAWLAATHVKRRIDTPPGTIVSHTVRVSAACVHRLRELSDQPLLLKLEDGVLRYQADDRPMAPVAVAPGLAPVALREVGVALSGKFGESWVAVVRLASPETVVADRLS
ncbi:MAG: hypothetical protein GX537_04805 [Actinobacteria bacterium]|jgi:hypothetical protein|nr:hypothetical protein [Actinomycetota bacterium]